MCRTQCVLGLVMLSVGLVHSWDIVVTESHQRFKLEFYSNNGELMDSKDVQIRYTHIVYDAVHNTVLCLGEQNDTDYVFSFDIATKKFQSLFGSKARDYNIEGVAFDPVTELIFWTIGLDTSIYWASLKPESKNNVYGNFTVKADTEKWPTAIAVDSCRGYIYWVHRAQFAGESTIERARFNGSEREIIINETSFGPNTLVIDQQTQKIYWADNIYGLFTHYPYQNDSFFIESADLNGKNRKTYVVKGQTQPLRLTVSKDSFYWLNWGSKFVWQLPKNLSIDRPKQIDIDLSGNDLHYYTIAANYKIEDQTQGSQDCEALTSLLPKNPVNNTSLNNSTDLEPFCVHGMKLKGRSLCKCRPGYTGERCNVSVCQNYCFQGDCSVSAEGQPICRCKYASYFGEKRKVNTCHGYCLNNGICTLNEKYEPVCQCTTDYEGERCGVPVCLNYCIQGECNYNVEGNPSCRCNTGYSGQRCEVNACFNYCLNNGICSLNEKHEPVCECTRNHAGSRCEVVKGFIFYTTTTYYSVERNLTLADICPVSELAKT